MDVRVPEDEELESWSLLERAAVRPSRFPIVQTVPIPATGSVVYLLGSDAQTPRPRRSETW